MGSLPREGRREPGATCCTHAAGVPASPTATRSLAAAAATPTLAVSVPLGPTVGPQGSDTMGEGPCDLSRPASASAQPKVSLVCSHAPRCLNATTSCCTVTPELRLERLFKCK